MDFTKSKSCYLKPSFNHQTFIFYSFYSSDLEEFARFSQTITLFRLQNRAKIFNLEFRKQLSLLNKISSFFSILFRCFLSLVFFKNMGSHLMYSLINQKVSSLHFPEKRNIFFDLSHIICMCLTGLNSLTSSTSYLLFACFCRIWILSKVLNKCLADICSHFEDNFVGKIRQLLPYLLISIELWIDDIAAYISFSTEL